MATGPPAAIAEDGLGDRARDHVTLALLVLSGAAWLLLWAWSLGGQGHHGGAGAAGRSSALALAAGWLVMVVAMMLPLAIELLGSVRRLTSRRARPGLYAAVAGAGFLAPWVLTGQVAQAADIGLRALVGWSGLTGAGVGVVAGCAVAAAGAFQLSPLKHRSLATCRSPVGFAMRRWTGGRPAVDAARIGAAYGASCVACCWALMAVMVAASAGGVLVMMPLAAVMVIERSTPWGPAVARAAGVLLIALGIAWVVASLALG